jgi:hypothetical protein
MKRFRWLIILAPLVLFAVGEDKAEPAKAKPQGRLTLPAEAEKIDAYTHRHKDKDGTVWIYRQTPFGLVRYKEADNPGPTTAKQEPAPVPSDVEVFDEGDQLRFEKPGPFGKYTWRRKKTELNAEERRIYEALKKKPETSEKPTQEQPE